MAKRGHGEGTIRKRKDGRWEARITAGFDPATGKQRQISKYFKTRTEAAAWVTEMAHAKQTGTFVEPNRITVGEWVNRWLDEYMKAHVRPKTWSTYKDMARLHIIPEIGSIPLRQLQTNDLQRLYNNKLENGRLDGKGGLSSRAVHMIHQIIHGALQQAAKEQVVFRNVSEAVVLPKLRYKEIQPLTSEQVSRFLETAKESRLYAAFLLELGTGLRRGELLALKWEDVDLKKGTAQVKQSLSRVRVNGTTKTALLFQEPKTKQSKRVVPIPHEALKELKVHKARQNEEKLFFGQAYQDNGLVFATEDGKPLDPDNFAKRYGTILKKAGLPHVSFHNLRHTYASLLLEAGEHPKVVQEILGHTKISTTMDIYSHVNPELKERAAVKINGFLKPKEKTVQQDGN
jgi:integrase